MTIKEVEEELREVKEVKEELREVVVEHGSPRVASPGARAIEFLRAYRSFH